MKEPVSVACVQTRPRETFEEAIEEFQGFLREAVAKRADLVMLPEYCGGLKSDGPRLVPPAADEESHPVLNHLREFAATNRVFVIAGSVAILGPGGKFRNRCYVLDDAGAILETYDKIHLFDIQLSESLTYRESASVIPGGEAVVASTPFGGIGLSICYDLRFPILYRDLAQGGAQILAIPAAFTKATGEMHWHALVRARAIENCCYVVAPCATGPVPGGGETYGHTLVVDPLGNIVADGGTEPGVVFAELDLGKVADTRARIPSLGHDRDYFLEVECSAEG